MRYLAAIAVVIALYAPDAFACSCSRTATPADAFASDLIFHGTVTKKTDRANFFRVAWRKLQELVGRKPDFTFDDHARNMGFLVQFDVHRIWRGSRERRVKVFTGRGDGDCGIPFELGKQYLVYGNCDPSGDCFTTVCGRTNHIERAGEDLRYLATKRSSPVP